MPDGSGKCIYEHFAHMHVYTHAQNCAHTNTRRDTHLYMYVARTYTETRTHTHTHHVECSEWKKNGFGALVYAECIQNFARLIRNFRISISKMLSTVNINAKYANLSQKKNIDVWCAIRFFVCVCVCGTEYEEWINAECNCSAFATNADTTYFIHFRHFRYRFFFLLSFTTIA